MKTTTGTSTTDEAAVHLSCYTDDVISNAMGLGQFQPSGMTSALRVLLKPAFHPELCITFEPTRVRVVSLQSMLWREPVPTRMPHLLEETTFSSDQFMLLTSMFGSAAIEHAADGKTISVDGLSVSVLLHLDNESAYFTGHPVGEKQREFVASILKTGHHAVRSPRLRNCIAECGRYVDQLFEFEPPATSPPPCNLLVLGTLDGRSDYLRHVGSLGTDGND